MAFTKQRYTFEDWLALPDDGKGYELLNGELVEMPPPTANHAPGRLHSAWRQPGSSPGANGANRSS